MGAQGGKADRSGPLVCKSVEQRAAFGARGDAAMVHEHMKWGTMLANSRADPIARGKVTTECFELRDSLRKPLE
jgi:hypothetical protein